MFTNTATENVNSHSHCCASHDLKAASVFILFWLKPNRSEKEHQKLFKAKKLDSDANVGLRLKDIRKFVGR